MSTQLSFHSLLWEIFLEWGSFCLCGWLVSFHHPKTCMMRLIWDLKTGVNVTKWDSNLLLWGFSHKTTVSASVGLISEHTFGLRKPCHELLQRCRPSRLHLDIYPHLLVGPVASSPLPDVSGGSFGISSGSALLPDAIECLGDVVRTVVYDGRVCGI